MKIQNLITISFMTLFVLLFLISCSGNVESNLKCIGKLNTEWGVSSFNGVTGNVQTKISFLDNNKGLIKFASYTESFTWKCSTTNKILLTQESNKSLKNGTYRIEYLQDEYYENNNLKAVKLTFEGDSNFYLTMVTYK